MRLYDVKKGRAVLGGKDVNEGQTWRFWSGIHIWIRMF